VEGGGDHNKALDAQCREGFSKFLRKAGLEGRMPRVVACGGRSAAYRSFRTSHQNAQPGVVSVLLVDSEAPVAEAPWEHVGRRSGDAWERPDGARDEQLHFMVQTMEAWFHADKRELGQFYGKEFRPDALSARSDIDNIPKADLFSGLHTATRNCRKGEYSKGDHSFLILARIDPAKVRTASPAHGGRLLDDLDRMCSR
jgi:hypothetical protein